MLKNLGKPKTGNEMNRVELNKERFEVLYFG